MCCYLNVNSVYARPLTKVAVRVKDNIVHFPIYLAITEIRYGAGVRFLSKYPDWQFSSVKVHSLNSLKIVMQPQVI